MPALDKYTKKYYYSVTRSGIVHERVRSGNIIVHEQVQVNAEIRENKVFVYLHKYRGVIMGNLYESIQILCKEKGVRPGRMCDDLGISRGLMTDLKMGRKKTVNAQTAQKIASYLGVTVARLLGHESGDVLDEIDVAFYGEFKELTEEQRQTVRDMVRLMRQRTLAEHEE